MPSRRSNASIAPRSVQASASRTMRSFSAGLKLRRLPSGATTSLLDDGGGGGDGDGTIDGLGITGIHSPPVATQVTRGKVSQVTLARRVRP